MTHGRQPERDVDRSEPGVPAIVLAGAVTIVLLVAAIIGLQFFYDRELESRALEPEPELLVNLRSREDEELNTYGHMDREKGTVRLPIDRAMALLAASAEPQP